VIPDEQTNCVYFSELLLERFPGLAQKVTGYLLEAGVTVRWIPGTRDIWCRDYMPIQVAKDRFVQFVYRPDYLFNDEYKDTITPPEVIRAVIPAGNTCEQSEIILDGGNVVRWSDKVIMTDKILKGLRGGQRAVRRQEIRELLELKELVVIPKEPYELYGHADGIVRFVDGVRVVVNDYSEVDPGYRERLLAALCRGGMEPAEIPYRPQETKGAGQSAFGVYVNFLQTSNVILVPAFGLPEDAVVVKAFSELFPATPIQPVDCRDLAKEGGVLNCVSWNVLV